MHWWAMLVLGFSLELYWIRKKRMREEATKHHVVTSLLDLIT